MSDEAIDRGEIFPVDKAPRILRESGELAIVAGIGDRSSLAALEIPALAGDGEALDGS